MAAEGVPAVTIRLGPKVQRGGPRRSRHRSYEVEPWSQRLGYPDRANVTELSVYNNRPGSANALERERITHLCTRLTANRWLCTCGRHHDYRLCAHVKAWLRLIHEHGVKKLDTGEEGML